MEMESQAGAVARELNFFYHLIGHLLIKEIRPCAGWIWAFYTAERFFQSYLVFLCYFKVIRFDVMLSFWLSW